MGSDDLRKNTISHNKTRRTALKKRKRSGSALSEIPRILILTEGCSEEIYFKELKNILSLRTVEIKKSGYTNSVGIVEEAIQFAKESQKNRNDYNYIFCVFDLDTVRNLSFIDVMSNYEATRGKVAYKKIIPIYTFPCIEIWFILHFTVCCKPFGAKGKNSIGDTVKEFLIKKYAEDYSETNECRIKSFANLYEQAVTNSINLMESQLKVRAINPICTIHKLVNLLQRINNRSKEGYTFDYQNKEESFIESNIRK